MNRLVKTLILAIAAASASTVKAQYAPGDLVIGFTKSTTDVMFDLGTPASIGVGGSGPVDLSSKISASLLNGSYADGLGSLSFGVVGESSSGPSGSQKFIYLTVAQGAPPPLTVPNVSSWNVISLNVDSAGAAIDGTATPANSAVVDNSTGTGLSFKENITSPTGNTFAKNYVDPTVSTPATFTSGSVFEDLYSASANNGTPKLLGTLSFGGDGSASFTPVPEPTTYTLVISGALAGLALKRRLARKV
jgi:hypothetical protein